jgi:hypothetical protein
MSMIIAHVHSFFRSASLGFLTVVLCTGLGISSAFAQHQTVIGAGTQYQIPIGTLQHRFLSSPGAMVFAGAEVSPHLTWIGKLTMNEFTKLNTESLTKTVTVGQGVSAQRFVLPLPKLTMDLKTVGVQAEAQVKMVQTELLMLNGVVGFGFTNWISTRGAYNDSLFVNDPSTGTPMKVAALAVPAHRQEDWSGTFNLGCELTVSIMDPISLYAGADYTLIVGELWQALDLDLENVAGMQFAVIRAGLKAAL